MKKLVFVYLIFLSVVLRAQDTIQNGYTRFYYPNGKLSSKGKMINGKPDGYWITYYVTGVKKSEGNRNNHLLDSIWVFFNEIGDTTEKISYVLGKRNGYYYKYTSSKEINNPARNVIIAKELYVNDKKEGLGYYYYENGKIHRIINYRNNKKHGISKEYNKDGIVTAIYTYINDYITEKENINNTLNGLPDGIWRDYYPNGYIKSEKTYKNGILDGYAKEYDEEGKISSTALFNEGKIIQDKDLDTINIEERLTYYDNKKVKTRYYFKNNLPIGMHRDYDINGNVLKTLVYNDKGELISNGIINDDGTREGKWNYFYSDGEIKSEGEFVNNRQNGLWKFYYKGGKNEQTGNFVNGYFEGEWKWYFPDGALSRIENFDNGKREGKFIEFTENGDTVQVGNYSDGMMNGPWIHDVGDVLEKGNYVNDLKEGEWKGYYSNGKLLYEGNFNQGFPDGKFSFYYDSGLLKEEQYYVNGIKEKVWKKYDSEGLLYLVILFRNDMEIKINGYKIGQ